MWWQCICMLKMRFLALAVQKLQHEQRDTQTYTRTDPTEIITYLHTRMVNIRERTAYIPWTRTSLALHPFRKFVRNFGLRPAQPARPWAEYWWWRNRMGIPSLNRLHGRPCRSMPSRFHQSQVQTWLVNQCFFLWWKTYSKKTIFLC